MKRFTGALILISWIFLCQGIYADGPKPHAKRNCVSPSAAEKYLALTTSGQRRVRSGITSDSSVSVNGNIVVVDASSKLLILGNAFDLKDKTVRFDPTSKSRYTFTLLPGTFGADVSSTLTVGDDDFYELIFDGFLFPFAGKTYDRCFVNSNGSITFEKGDPEPPDAETLLSGPPRIAAFFADLDPESAGTVYLNQTSDSLTVTWLKVPEFFNENQFAFGQNTFQIVLYSSGRIDLNYSKEITATEAITGIIAGNGNPKLKAVDFSKNTSRSQASPSFIENFRNYESVDIAPLLQTVYAGQKDEYDFVSLFSNFELTPVPGTQAFAINVQNDVAGIGNPAGRGKSIFQDSKKYGSAKRLQNITFFGNLREFPSDPNRDLANTYASMLEILAHEVGHRWLSYVKFSRDGGKSELLLGRDKSHWSFFLDSDGSFLEGNQIQRTGSNSFSTTTPFTGYSDLDLYLMGLLAPEEAEDAFLVEDANQFSPAYNFSAQSSPEPGIKFRGSAAPVRMEDIIAANGKRSPDTASSQKKFQHLFVLIVKQDNPAAQEDLAYLELLRVQWEQYFSAATGGRAQISTGVK